MQQEINFIVLACTLFTLRYYVQGYIVYIIMYESNGEREGGGGGERERKNNSRNSVNKSVS